MQPKKQKMLTDGERLKKLRADRGLTWDEIASDLGVSRSMLHAVSRAEKRLGRDAVSRLALIEGIESTAGSHADKASESAAGEPYTTKAEILGHIVWLEDQLTAARQSETRLAGIIETLATAIAGPRPSTPGRSDTADAPPGAAPACGVRYNTRKTNSA